MQAKRGLSQNFLIDGNIIQKIVDTASVSKGDLIIEIGPGPGALTEALLEKGAFVTAIEMDAKFAQALERLQTREGHLEVICADILKFPLVEFLQKHPGKHIKLSQISLIISQHRSSPSFVHAWLHRIIDYHGPKGIRRSDDREEKDTRLQ